MITIGGRLIQNLEDLSERFQRVLLLIPGGNQWFSWAVEPTARLFNAASEIELIVQIQEGLHRTGQIPIPASDVVVNVGNLMTLSDKDFGVIMSAGDPSITSEKAKVISENQWLSGTDLASATQWLQRIVGSLGDSDLSLRAKLIFQVLTLSDQTALYQLSTKATGAYANSAYQDEATAFGVTQTQDPREFVDAYNFYMAALEKLEFSDENTSSELRAQHITSAWNAMLPVTNYLLSSPSFGADSTGSEVIDQIDRWIAAKNVIGFATQASALSNLMQSAAITQSEFSTEGDSDQVTFTTAGKAAVDDYMVQAMRFIGESDQPYSNRISQDGLDRIIEFRTDREIASLSVNLWGTVTLSQYSKN